MAAERHDFEAVGSAVSSVSRALTDVFIGLIGVLMERGLLSRTDVEERLLNNLQDAARELLEAAPEDSIEHGEAQLLGTLVGRLRSNLLPEGGADRPTTGG